MHAQVYLLEEQLQALTAGRMGSVDAQGEQSGDEHSKEEQVSPSGNEQSGAEEQQSHRDSQLAGARQHSTEGMARGRGRQQLA